VVQHPVVCNVRSDSLDPFSKSFQDIFVEGVIVDEIGLPERGSFAAFSQPYLKALCHLKTIGIDRVASS